MTWRSPGMSHFWCTKCNKQVAADGELIYKEGQIFWKWRCPTCNNTYETLG